MIITCEQCQTRFKIPDEKVSPKGVKVRCTKCQHTFRVSRPESVDEIDPFALFSSSPGPAAPPASPPSDPLGLSMEGFFGEGQLNGPAPPAMAPLGGGSAPPPAANPPPSPAAPPAGLDIDLGGEPAPDHSFFEMPHASAEEPPPEASSPGGGLLSDIPDLQPEPSGVRASPRSSLESFAPTSSPTPAPASAVATPAAFEEPRPVTWGVRLVQTVVAALVVALICGAAVVALNGGKLPKPTTKSRNVGAVASAVQSGMYETHTGRPVLFVEGQAENRGSRAEWLRVKVELMEGGQPLRSGQTLAGSTATPEDLYRLGSVTDTEALRIRLDAQARSVAPGGAAPFLVAFYEFPPDSALTVRVEVEPEQVQPRAGP